jgi:NAD(P)H dehydrogenase (quinone)
MATMTALAITGGTGELGGRVARRLAERGVAQRLIVRDAARAPVLPGAEVMVSPGYHDRDAMGAAFAGAETIFLVSGRESATRVQEHRTAIDAAVDAGVRRVVYTSFLGAAPDCTFTLGRQHWATEEHLRASGLEWTFLQDAMYLDVVPLLVGEDGVVRGPAGDGRVAWVARDDVADAAVTVLTGDGHEGQTYRLTGAEATSLGQAARILEQITGRPITYIDETEAQAYASRAHFNAPAFEVEGWVTSYLAIRDGDFDVITDAIPTLTGHPAQTLRSYLQANPSSWAHLRPSADVRR